MFTNYDNFSILFTNKNIVIRVFLITYQQVIENDLSFLGLIA